jgi:hypothetical protein
MKSAETSSKAGKPQNHRRFAREASRPENNHVRAPSLAQRREVFRLETERWISNDWVVQYRGHFCTSSRRTNGYGPTQPKALICERDGVRKGGISKKA